MTISVTTNSKAGRGFLYRGPDYRRNVTAATEFAKEHPDLTAEDGPEGWKAVLIRFRYRPVNIV